MSSKVFVGGLNFKTTQQEIEQLFSQAGEIQSVFLPTERETGRPRGFAFVEYGSESEAAAAIEKFNGHELAGRTLRVNAAEEKPPSRGGSFGGPRGGSGSGGGGFRPGGGGGGGGDRFGGNRPKGSRRNVRAKKRSL